jgi:Asp-tRNA(Asn)/Glu-tRNA(Gln) amidotransferase A subunit family amidase
LIIITICPILAQVNIPAGEAENAPLGVSLMAKHGADRFLLDTTLALYPTVQEEVKKSQASRNTVAAVNGKNNAAEIAKEKVAYILPTVSL